jgi:hypothetical protein
LRMHARAHTHRNERKSNGGDEEGGREVAGREREGGGRK